MMCDLQARERSVFISYSVLIVGQKEQKEMAVEFDFLVEIFFGVVGARRRNQALEITQKGTKYTANFRLANLL